MTAEETEAEPGLRGPKTALSVRERAQLVDFAVECAEAAGEVIRPHFRNVSVIDNKLGGSAAQADYDPVTRADRDAEALIRERIASRFPDHGVLGEEFGHQPGAGLTWVLDPLDGTRAFVTGFLHWGTLVALFDGDEVVLGVMHQPVTRETFWGTGESAFYRQGSGGVPLRTRACSALSDAVIGTTHPGCFPDPAEWRAFETLSSQCKMLRYGGDCYGYGMLAMGQLDLVVEAALNPYDIQALLPIVRGAGGVATSWDGGDPSLGGTVVAAGDPTMHAAALAILQAS